MEILPLSWPKEKDEAGKIQRFLSDVPFLGMRASMFRSFRKEIKKRTYRTLELWGDDVNMLKCLCIVSPIVKECFNWPNTCFIPNDPCEILFWDPSIDWRDAVFINHIKKELSLSGNFWNDVNSLTYGQFIEKIIKQLNESL